MTIGPQSRPFTAFLVLLGSACALRPSPTGSASSPVRLRNDFSIMVLPASPNEPIYRFETAPGMGDSVRIAHLAVYPCGKRPIGTAFGYFTESGRRPPFLRELRHGDASIRGAGPGPIPLPFTPGCWYVAADAADGRMAIAFFSLGTDGVVHPFSQSANDSTLRVWNLAGSPITDEDTVLGAWAAVLGFIATHREAAIDRPWLTASRKGDAKRFPRAWLDSLQMAQVISGYCDENCPPGLKEGAFLELRQPKRGHVDTIEVDVEFTREPTYCDRHYGHWFGSTELGYDVVPLPLGGYLVSRGGGWPLYSDGICTN